MKIILSIFLFMIFSPLAFLIGLCSAFIQLGFMAGLETGTELIDNLIGKETK